MMRHLRLWVIVVSVLAAPAAHAAKVTEVTGDQGIKAWLVEERSLPLVAVRILFTGAGSAYDPAGLEGRANMTAALLMEGAGDYDARAFGEALESRAISLQMGVDEDAFSISLETLSEHKEEAFRMLGLALNEPRFDDSAIARVKTQTLSLIKDNASRPGYVLERAWAEAAFGKHPYAKPALGTSSSVEALSADDFRDVTRRYLTRANIIVAVAGDISAEEVKRLLDQQLARLPKNVDPDSTLTDVTLPGTATTQTVPFDVPQTMVRFGTQSIRRQDPDYMNAYVMNHILGGGGSLNTRLGREIREKRGFSYAVFSGLNPMTHGATWQGGFATRSEQVDEAVKTLTTTLKDFAEHGPSDVEFEDAKRYLTGSFVLGLDSNGDIAAFLVTMQRFQLGIDYLDRRNALVEAVTLEEVRRLAKKIVAPETLLIVMVGKERMPASSGAAAP